MSEVLTRAALGTVILLILAMAAIHLPELTGALHTMLTKGLQ